MPIFPNLLVYSAHLKVRQHSFCCLFVKNTVFFFSLENLDGLRKIVPNRSCLYRPSPGVYGARIPKGSETVCVLKYKVQTENVDPTEKIPIAVKTTWSQNQQDDLEARLDVDYAVSDTFGYFCSFFHVVLSAGFSGRCFHIFSSLLMLCCCFRA